jgi:hypothetical protein
VTDILQNVRSKRGIFLKKKKKKRQVPIHYCVVISCEVIFIYFFYIFDRGQVSWFTYSRTVL